MKVRMKIRLLGTLDGIAYPAAGETWVVDDAVGANLCRKGFAEPVAEVAPAVEVRAGGEGGEVSEPLSRPAKKSAAKPPRD